MQNSFVHANYSAPESLDLMSTAEDERLIEGITAEIRDLAITLNSLPALVASLLFTSVLCIIK